MRISKLLVVIFAFTLSGCATNSGVIPVSPDTYMLITTLDKRVASLVEANQYCQSLGKSLIVVETKFLKAVWLNNQVTFMCLADGDPRLVSTIPKTSGVVDEDVRIQIE